MHCRIRTREQLIVEHEDEAEVIRDRNYQQTERVSYIMHSHML